MHGLDQGKKSCKQAGLVSYLRTNPDGNTFAKGQDKDIILAKLHILQLRSANARSAHENDTGFKIKKIDSPHTALVQRRAGRDNLRQRQVAPLVRFRTAPRKARSCSRDHFATLP